MWSLSEFASANLGVENPWPVNLLQQSSYQLLSLLLTVSTKQIVLHVDSTFSLSSGRVHSHVGDVLHIHISKYDGSDAVSEKPENCVESKRVFMFSNQSQERKVGQQGPK